MHGTSEGLGTWDNAGMAILLPADLDLSKLPHSERRVCESLMAGLDDSWFVIPSVPVVDDGNDGEIDVILVSAEAGVFVVDFSKYYGSAALMMINEVHPAIQKKGITD